MRCAGSCHLRSLPVHICCIFVYFAANSCHLYRPLWDHLCQNSAPVPCLCLGLPRRGQSCHVCPQRICLLHLLSSLVDPTLLLALFETCSQVFSTTYLTPPGQWGHCRPTHPWASQPKVLIIVSSWAPVGGQTDWEHSGSSF